MIRAAIIGLGWWGKTLVEAVGEENPHIRFVAGTTRTLSEDAQAFANERGLKLHADYSGVLNDRDIDAVVLATRHSAHTAQIVAAAAHGKHVFCEKPLALTKADAERAAEAATRYAG